MLDEVRIRFESKPDKWNDERGFGFVTPTRGGEPVFVHVSAFPHDGRRPQLGEALTFEVGPAGDGKERAIKVERPGAAPRPLATVAPRDTSMRSHRPARPGSFAGPVIGALLLAGVGGFAFVQFNAAQSGFRPPKENVPPASAPQSANQACRCDGRTHCSQMTSCDEATFFLRNCPGTQMDGDGIPCESQWCASPF